MIRPQQHLVDAGRDFPDIWKKLDSLHKHRGGQLYEWPSWCFMPVGVMPNALARNPDELPREQMNYAMTRLAPLYSWRLTQGVYRFDPDIYNALSETPLDATISTDTLTRLPEYCVYIETQGLSFPGMPGEKIPVYGFFAQALHSHLDDTIELRLTLDTEVIPGMPGGLFTIPLFFQPDKKIKEVLDYTVSEKTKDFKEGLAGKVPDFAWGFLEEHTNRLFTETARRLLPFVMYLCSESAEIEDPVESLRKPMNPRSKKTKKGLRYFPAKSPTVWETGFKTGRSIREAMESMGEGGGASVRPHIRKAHWHQFWTGSRKDPKNRRLVLRWLPPIPVNVDETSDLIPTIRNVTARD